MTSVDRTAMQRPRPNWLPEEEFPFESKFLQVNGHSIHYIDEGSGSLLLFVHAGPAWMFAYRDLIRRMSSGFRCVALDFPGAGLSSAAEDYEPGLEAASKILEAFVITLDLTDVTLIAHDLGTPVGLAAFRHHPERMHAIAVTEGFGWSLSQENPRVARMLRLVGSRPFRAINWATNLLAWGMGSSYGVGRHLTRSGKVAFRGPYRDRRVRGRALTMLRDAARADAWLHEVDLMLESVSQAG